MDQQRMQLAAYQQQLQAVEMQLVQNPAQAEVRASASVLAPAGARCPASHRVSLLPPRFLPAGRGGAA